jgi:Arc/MetJ-type ribon-helix-helix transcriptional regulator
MATTAYLDKESEERAKKLLEEESFDSVSGIVKEALKLMEREMIQHRLREKYRDESPVEDKVEEAQAESAEELGDYPW